MGWWQRGPSGAVTGDKPLLSLCYAPHGSMYFDPRGKVRACCQNRSGYVGDVTEQTLREIWGGAESQAMREQLEAGTFPPACTFCEWQSREGNVRTLFARHFDELPIEGSRPPWPTQMEFALSNACNLECVMCAGGYSSAIRSRREHRPPLPAVYGDRFFDELAEFLPRLTEAKFYGGEPLVGRESLRVLRMLADLDAAPRVTITTNATVGTPQVEALLGSLRPHVVVSLDGASAATFDSIRVGAHLPTVLSNIDVYAELIGPGKMSLTTCLMVDNVHEFPELLNLSSARGMHLGVNVLHHPPELSLYQLPAKQLRNVVDSMAARRADVAADRLDIFDDQLEALTNRLSVISAASPQRHPGEGLPLAPYLHEPHRTSRWGWLPFAEHSISNRFIEPPPARLGADYFVGTDGVVRRLFPERPVPPDLVGLDGAPIEDLEDAITLRCRRPMEQWTAVHHGPIDSPDFHLLRPGGPDAGDVELTIMGRRDDSGRLIGARYRLSLTSEGAALFGAPPTPADGRGGADPPRSSAN